MTDENPTPEIIMPPVERELSFVLGKLAKGSRENDLRRHGQLEVLETADCCDSCCDETAPEHPPAPPEEKTTDAPTQG